MGTDRPPGKTRRARLPVVIIAVGIAVLASAGIWQLRETLWMSHYHQVGSALVRQEQAEIAAGKSGAAVSGSPLSAPNAQVTPASTTELTSAPKSAAEPANSCATNNTDGPQGLLEIPELGVVAPIEQGSSDPVLAVAVGHDPYSVWPGTNGTAVLLSHDVTYFVNIGRLKVGQLATYVTPCSSYEYRVSASKIVSAGTAIYNSAYSTIALVTCYPNNALFYTNEREVVTLSLVKATTATKPKAISLSANGVPTADAKAPAVHAPTALIDQGLTLDNNYAPMGVLSVLGEPNPRYTQSPAPLLAQDSALEAYFGALKSLTQRRIDWWDMLAPHVAPPATLIGHAISSYSSALDVDVIAHDFSISGVTLQDAVVIASRTYPMKVTMAISRSNVLTITSWTI
jgi:LPXTG-site transpeptidase (sortase) family protein